MIFLISKDISKIDISRLRLNSVGMYFCEMDKHGLRLSIEGSQIVGSKAVRNVVELNDEEAKKWFTGSDIEKECRDSNGFVILKHKNDFIGNGKYSNGRILNYFPKTRRIKTSNPANF